MRERDSREGDDAPGGEQCRLLLGSMLAIAVFSGVVVTEAERNFAAVTVVDETTASVETAAANGDGASIIIAVQNTMGQPLRLQYVHLTVEGADGRSSASVPYNGYETLPPGESTLTTGITERQFEGDARVGDSVIVSGHLAVEVYNAYRFQVPIDEREVTL